MPSRRGSTLLGTAASPVPGSTAAAGGARSWSITATRSVSYDVRMVPGLLDPDNGELEARVFAGPSRRRLFIVERTVFDIFGDQLMTYLGRRGLPAELVCVAADEMRKGIALSGRIVDAVDEFGIDRRREPIVAIGGGVLLDVVGWVASCYRRGTPYVKIPTTLVGLVDAGIGVKTGINYNGHKNRLGSYHPPEVVLLDPYFLTTLPAKHISNGLAEIAKMGLMCDAQLWSLLTRHAEALVSTKMGSTCLAFAAIGHEAMTRAVHAMLAQLQTNLWETTLHRLVDFGHTFSPELEMLALPALLHGEAVAIDMAISCALAAGRGLMPEPLLRSVLSTLARLGLPLTHPAASPALLERGLEGAVQHRAGRQRLPVPVRPGRATFIEGVGAAELDSAWRWLQDYER